MGIDSKGVSDILKTASASVRAWIIIVFALTLVGVYIWLQYGSNPNKPAIQSDCDFIKEQNKQLVTFLIEAKKEVEQLSVQPISFIDNQQWNFSLAIMYDTIPKPKTAQQKLLSKFDSVLLKIKQDSINRVKSKQ